jgi:hypothetical protein
MGEVGPMIRVPHSFQNGFLPTRVLLAGSSTGAVEWGAASKAFGIDFVPRTQPGWLGESLAREGSGELKPDGTQIVPLAEPTRPRQQMGPQSFALPKES